jgi:hypothetical protein
MRRLPIATAISLAILLVVALIATGAVQNGQSGGPSLSAQGRLLYNFEGLLTKSFGNRSVYAARPMNFSCAGICAPASRYSPYRFVFRQPHNSSFHVTRRRFRDGDFGNFPIPVLIRGHAIACDVQDAHFLVEYRNAASFALGCLAPLH